MNINIRIIQVFGKIAEEKLNMNKNHMGKVIFKKICLMQSSEHCLYGYQIYSRGNRFNML